MDDTRNTVFVVDDSTEVCASLSRLLDAAGYRVRCFSCAEYYLAEDNEDAPGCLLLDVGMAGLSGPELQQALLARCSERPIVYLSANENIRITVEAMRSGAIDFLTKPVDHARLFAALDRAFLRDADNRRRRTIRQTIQRRFDSLTPRERQVMSRVVCGRLNKLIAAEIGTGEKTVKVHRARMMAKMAADSVAELVLLGTQLGISMAPTLRTDAGSGKQVLDWIEA